ncbi:MAG: hypothetical protein QW091_02435 [Candidatus Micrarchaeaceae archaeon]
MIDAIVSALENDSVIAIPTENVKLDALVGKNASYTDSSDRNWPGKVVAVQEPGVVVKFDSFPTGLGQGQIMQIEY